MEALSLFNRSDLFTFLVPLHEFTHIRLTSDKQLVVIATLVGSCGYPLKLIQIQLSLKASVACHAEVLGKNELGKFLRSEYHKGLSMRKEGSQLLAFRELLQVHE